MVEPVSGSIYYITSGSLQIADFYIYSQVFPNYTANSRPVSKNSVLATIKAQRAAKKQACASQDININK